MFRISWWISCSVVPGLMKKLLCNFVVVLLAAHCTANKAVADVIVGPALPFAGSIGGSANNHDHPEIGTGCSWGLQFTANKSSELIGFDFTHAYSIFGNPNSGTISLIDVIRSHAVDQWNVPANAVGNLGTLSFTAADVLRSGDVYQLIYTQQDGASSDEFFAYLGAGSYPPSFQTGAIYNYTNQNITLTNGVEITLKNGVENEHLTSSSGFSQWFAFNNINTVPEPSTFALLGLGGLGLLARTIRGRRLAASV
jgi:hypothetical protein